MFFQNIIKPTTTVFQGGVLIPWFIAPVLNVAFKQICLAAKRIQIDQISQQKQYKLKKQKTYDCDSTTKAHIYSMYRQNKVAQKEKKQASK